MGRFRKTSLSYKKSKKSKSREKKGTKFEEEKKTVLKESDRGSWYEQEDWFPENLSSESSADCSDSEDDERLSEGDFSKPANNLYLVSPFFLEQGLNSAASCKYCNCNLVILSNEKGRQGLGTSWIFKCVNDKCPYPIEITILPMHPHLVEHYFHLGLFLRLRHSGSSVYL